MPTFLEALEGEGELVRRIAAHATQTECPDFGDLWWDNIDLDAVLNDPGVMFESPSRLFVVARINGELRYFAGGKTIYDDAYDYELGTFDTLKQALAFAEAYLVGGSELRDIEMKREVRRARLEARPGGILRPHFDHR
jgi:hypothetical protein